MKVHDTPATLIVLIVAQSLCAAFFLWDVLRDGLVLGWPPFVHWHFMVEAFAVLALIAGVVFEAGALMRLLRRKAWLERQVSVAAGALHAVMEAQFNDWSLTPSEADVATLAIKGMTISEIAALRGSAEGTVKSHLGSVYRKAGLSGRGALLAHFIESLLDHPALDKP
ncbi:helix-turn-helix transcriptional regulator [Thalassococcus sp. CAU 1522]|uniref:Helix-turn-helix transcriptional regulator n=1 Tax=Thalassococcus arenae TaxID=2851652 RepID=A0ABS6NAL2_9RHOB|nr:helix-turn-helix transcriptional regulator [Thalassococcus arenae]MBV2361039.1 helix-turn-helix transcriptional regulator [Thalassococcus arenae]